MYVQRGVMYGPLTYIPYSSHIASHPFRQKKRAYFLSYLLLQWLPRRRNAVEGFTVWRMIGARGWWFFFLLSVCVWVCVCVKRTGKIENQTKTFRRRRCRHHHHHHHADEDESSGVTFVYRRRWWWETETTHQKPLRKTRRIDEWPFSLLCRPFVLFLKCDRPRRTNWLHTATRGWTTKRKTVSLSLSLSLVYMLF
jgi:hypothetical protein